MKIAVEMTEVLRYKLYIFGVPIDGTTNIYCDNEAVTKNVAIPESVLKKKHHCIAYHRCREAVVAGTIRVAKQKSLKKTLNITMTLTYVESYEKLLVRNITLE